MIDKVLLRTYDTNAYQILNPLAFTRDIKLKTMGKNWHQNNTTHALPGYHPHVVINRYPNPRPRACNILQALELECSLPKIVFQQNIYELKTRDFNRVCNRLSGCLLNMGIQMMPADIAYMDVRKIEYSKNMLTGNVPVSYILEELYQAKPINHYMDVQRVAYRNGGEGLVFYCKGYDISLYDKYAEVQKLLKTQPNIFPGGISAALKKPTANILRMEVRFHDSTTLLNFLKTHQLATGVKLQDVFSQDISKYVLNHYWDKISQSVRGVAPFVMSPAFELWKINSGSSVKEHIQKKLAKVAVHTLLRKHGYHGAKDALLHAGDTNPTQTLRKYGGLNTFKARRKLNVWKFIDKTLQRFCCLDKKRWQRWHSQTRGAWFYDTEPFLTLNEVADWLNVTIKEIKQLIKDKLLQATQIGTKWRVNRYHVLDFAHTH